MLHDERPLTFHVITSRAFWVGAPLLIVEIIKRGHYLSAFDEKALPSTQVLLDADVFIDMSTITRSAFYLGLERVYQQRRAAGARVPLMMDPPRAVLGSFNKTYTHRMFPDLVPESYELSGRKNSSTIKKLEHDEFVVIKPVVGWCGIGVERLTVEEALKKHARSKGLIVQKYIPVTRGVGRILTLHHKGRVQIVCNYLRVMKSWRTGIDVEYSCVEQSVNNELRLFAETISRRCGLYLNGIDYLYENGKHTLLEVNAVPAIKEPMEEFGIDVPRVILDNMEKILRSG